MTNNLIKRVVLVFSMVFITISSAQKSSDLEVVNDTVKLIDLAGKQRMLSQRIAKDYIYKGKRILFSKSKRELKKSIKELIQIQNTLNKSINDPKIKNLLMFVDMSIESFEETAEEKFSLDNAQIIIDLSESMLEGSQYVVDSLKDTVKISESNIIALAGKQRMLSQRIAKYYIAYQSGIKDETTVDQMNEAVRIFAKAHATLLKNKRNTPAINRKLNQIDRLWKIVYKFYIDIEKGGLSLIVFNTTSNITKKMNDVTKLYIKVYK